MLPYSEIIGGPGADHIRDMEAALARIDIQKKGRGFLELLDNYDKWEKAQNRIYFIISNSRKQELLQKYNDLCSLGIRLYFIIPELSTVELEEYVPKDINIIKYTLV